MCWRRLRHSRVHCICSHAWSLLQAGKSAEAFDLGAAKGDAEFAVHFFAHLADVEVKVWTPTSPPPHTHPPCCGHVRRGAISHTVVPRVHGWACVFGVLRNLAFVFLKNMCEDTCGCMLRPRPSPRAGVLPWCTVWCGGRRRPLPVPHPPS
jgi:hypothetical protein